ncbi:MAG: energy transducer TonB [Methylococcaceae bacterium]|nr:energy transducer TonB [Methylococcaceae bacterium]
MNRPLPVFDHDKPPALVSEKKKTNVIAIKPDVHRSSAARWSGVATGVLADFRPNFTQRDNKLVDYLLIGILSVLIHSVVYDHFQQSKIEDEQIAAIKPPPKVQISFVRPQPKHVDQPPPPPPPPKVVALKKPPKPKVKPKPAPKPVVQTPPPPIATTTEVTDSAAPVMAAPPPPPPPPPVEKVTQPSAGAGYLNNPPPVYPELAMERGWEGKVVMKVHVLASGKPDQVNVQKSSGKDILDDEAVRTVRQWSFVPAKRGTTPIDGWVTIPITFNIQA